VIYEDGRKERPMSIITISRGSYSRGKEVAEKLAQRLGYECVSRDVLIEASDEFNIPEIKLVRAIHDSPSVLDRFTHGKEKYVAYIRAAVLKRVQKDNVVYHGLAGHFFLQDVPHVMKVRIIADFEDRVKEEMKRENISAEKARYTLKKDDDERRKWGLSLYGADTADNRLYDMVLHIKTLNIEDAVDILFQTVNRPSFRTTPESRKALENLSLAAQVQAALVAGFPSARVTSKNGKVFVSNIETSLLMEREVVVEVTKMARKVPGVEEVTVSTTHTITSD
jgi:cytidylate kinase